MLIMPVLSKKRWSSKVCRWICSVWPSWFWESQHASTGNSVSWSLGLWVIAVHPAFIAGHQSIKNCKIWIDQLDHLPAVMTTSFFLILSEHPWDKPRAIFRIFSSSRIIVCTVPTLTSNCALIVSIDTRRSVSMKFFIWPINSGVLTSLLLPHLSSSLTDSMPSLSIICHKKTYARFMQDAPKAVWSIPYVSVVFFPSLK